MSYYAEYDTVKTKMRVPDDSLKDELMNYIQEVEELINNRLRQRLGSRDAKGREITLPLTTSTTPALDEELKAIEQVACPSAGSCGGQFTANTMACISEAMGLALTN